MNASVSPLKRLSALVLLAAVALLVSASPALARYAYTVDYTTGTSSVIDLQANAVVGTPIPTGPTSTAYTNAITPDGKYMFFGNDDGTIAVVDLQTRTVVGSPIDIGGEIEEIAISPDGKTAYVTDSKNNRVVVIDTQTMQVSGAPIALPGQPYGVAFAPNGGFAYVTDMENNSIHVIDTQTRQIVGAPIPVGESPTNVAFTPSGALAFVANEDSDTVSVIDVQTAQKLADVPVGEEPWEVAITPDGLHAYVTNYASDDVSVIDTQTRQVVGAPIPVGSEPYGVAVTPDGRTAYVVDYGSEDISVIDTATNQVTKTIPMPGAGAWLLAIAPDQSPLPSFSLSAGVAGKPTAFNASASTDPDSPISAFEWSFGDGTTASTPNVTVQHTYEKAATYTPTLDVRDTEGCGSAMVFTGRTASCSGAPLATAPITVLAPNDFKFGKLVRNKKKGIAMLKVKLPYAGIVQLWGKGVVAAKRKAGKAKTVSLPIKAKGKQKKALIANGSVKLKVSVKFKPNGGQAKTKAKSLKLVKR